MNVNDMITQTYQYTGDASAPTDQIIDLLNEALLITASLFNLPVLESTYSFPMTTGAFSVSLTGSFHHSMFMAQTNDYPGGLKILPNRKDIINLQNDENETGTPMYCAEENGEFYYYPVPSDGVSLVVTAHFYSMPATMYAGGPGPSCIPEQYHRDVLVSYAAKTEIAKDPKMSTGQARSLQYHEAKYGEGVAKMARLFKYASRRIPTTVRRIQFF